MSADSQTAGGDIRDSRLAVDRPYGRGWLQMLLDGLERIPGPTWLWIVVVGLLVGVVTQAQAWESGQARSGELNVPSLYWASMAIALLWCVGYIEDLGSAAVEAFRPAFRGSGERLDRLRFELTVIPVRGSGLILVAAIALTVAAFVVAPADAGVLGVSAPIVAASFIAQVLAAGVLFTLAYQLVRQMRIVRAAMAEADVDVFRPRPLQALPLITARTGAFLVIVVEASLFFVPTPPDFRSFLVNSAPFLVLPPVVATIAFVLPLRDVHGRLVAEKGRLLGETEERLKAILAQINHDVDAGDLSRADGLNKALASMLSQRDVIAKLPTWPWSTGTIRGFVTAILLPLILFAIQQLIAESLRSAK